MLSYAQNREDVILARALSGVSSGFYIDVGANDPVHHSVTKHFYNAGWSGINVEASTFWYERLVADRARDINLNVAASQSEGSLKFFELEGTGLSTTVDHFASQGESLGFNKVTYDVQARTLDSIITQYAPSTDIHFLKIDVEGAEESVLKGIDLNKFRPWIIVVEAAEPLSDVQTHEKWEDLITENGYSFELFDKLNRWYLARERKELAKYFAFSADEYELVDNYWTRNYLREQLEHATKANEKIHLQLRELVASLDKQE